MTPQPPSPSPRRRRGPERRLHVIALLLLCAIAYFPGLDNYGVANWQEAQRLVVAREMQDRFRTRQSEGIGAALEELIVPTANARPYLAKPPMFYWAQIGVAELLGQRVELWHLRLVIALAGTLGVLATYVCARVILSPPRRDAEAANRHEPTLGIGGVRLTQSWADAAAFWGAAMLATGVLFVRSARIGELDILLVPFCTLAIACVVRAWRRHLEQRSTDWPAIFAAFLATSAAVLTKDPGVMVVGFAAYGGISLWAAWARSGTPVDAALLVGRCRAPLIPIPEARSGIRIIQWTVAAACAVAAGVLSARNVREPVQTLGVAIIALGVGTLAFTLARLLEPVRFRAMFVAMSRTHPLIVIGGAVLVRVGWGLLVARLIGSHSTQQLVAQEVEDNIRPFLPEAPLNNIEAMLFGVGLASVAAPITLLALWRERPRLPATWMPLLAWLLFLFLAFSVLGKGVQRYLTPMWPALAIAGGIGVALLLESAKRPGRVSTVPLLRGTLLAALFALAIGQGAWYGHLRNEIDPERSPRDLVQDLLRTPGVVRRRMVSIEFAHPGLDYYLDEHVQPVGDARVNASMSGGDSITFERLHRSVEHVGPVYAFIRTARIPGVDAPPALDRLRDAGFTVEPVETSSVFIIDGGRSQVRCYRLKIDN
ncbi:MAG TPA: phospholipid carrier-dependent glycosyltransferase [Phycisphaerales bacterium]|nr:phospholipid carrier-dependent glycosyltransferase [Phycisphaerales bacterium]